MKNPWLGNVSLALLWLLAAINLVGLIMVIGDDGVGVLTVSQWIFGIGGAVLSILLPILIHIRSKYSMPLAVVVGMCYLGSRIGEIGGGVETIVVIRMLVQQALFAAVTILSAWTARSKQQNSAGERATQ